MALAYLLDPSFQTLNENGRPLVGGYIEVYYHNTSTKYVTKADFEGTNNPFKVPLNSKGMAVIIASDQLAYDVFCYDRFGALFWSRPNVNTIGGSGGGGGGGGSYASVLVATAEIIEGDDSALSKSFGFSESEKIGEDIYIQEGSVKCNAGVYHVDFSISIAINQTTPPRPWVENVSIYYGVGYAYINLDRSNMDPTASDSVDVGYDIVVDTDGTTLPVTLIGLGTKCYATMQHFNVHKVAEAEQ